MTSTWRAVGALLLALAVCSVANSAAAQGFSGTISYTGALGPVGARRPLCLCLYRDAALTNPLGCLIYRNTPINYQVTRLSAADYYAVAFLDLHINEQLDPDEPYEIYLGRAEGPADPISAAANPTGVDFTFGDENLPPPPPSATPTETVPPTASATPAETPTATPTPDGSAPTPTPIPPRGAGDCDGDGAVSVAELVRAVGIALGSVDVTTCAAVDLDGDGSVRIDELITALNRALAAGG